MNLSLKFQSRRHPECGDEAFGPLMVEQRCYCGPKVTTSTSQQTAKNQQVGLQTAPGGSGVAFGAYAKNNTSSQSTSDSGNPYSGNTNSGNPISSSYNTTNTTTIAGDVAVSQAGLDLAGHAITAMVSQDQHSQDLMAGLGSSAINLGGSAINLGGSAINLGGAAVGAAFQFAQNQSVMNYNALNTNTAMAFSTINAIDTANAAAAVSAAAQDTLAATLASGTQMQQPAAIDTTGLNTPYTATSRGISTTEIVGIGLAVVAVAIFMHHGTR